VPPSSLKLQYRFGVLIGFSYLTVFHRPVCIIQLADSNYWCKYVPTVFSGNVICLFALVSYLLKSYYSYYISVRGNVCVLWNIYENVITVYLQTLFIVMEIGFGMLSAETSKCSYQAQVTIGFKVSKSVHHRTIQINHQRNATVFQFIILTFIYNSICFGRFPAHHQELNDCSGSLWFYLRIVVIAVLCSSWPTTNTALLSPR
jgi:hypothetical protein